MDIVGKIVRKTKDGVLGKYFELSIKDDGQGMSKREYRRVKKIIKK